MDAQARRWGRSGSLKLKPSAFTRALSILYLPRLSILGLHTLNCVKTSGRHGRAAR